MHNSTFLISRHLRSLQAALPARMFFRCHHSHLINLGHVLRLVPHAAHSVMLSTNEVVEVSRRRWKALVLAVKG